MSDTKEYIIEQAYSLFLSRSYEAVSISDISKAIGLTKGALYHHFASKEELFKAVIDKYLLITEIDAKIDEISLAEYIEESIKKASEIINCIFGEMPAYIPINYLALFIDAFRHYNGFADDKGKLIEKETDNVKKVMDNAIIRKEIRADIDTKLAALNYFSIATGLAANLLFNNSPKDAIKSLGEQLYEFYKLLKIN